MSDRMKHLISGLSKIGQAGIAYTRYKAQTDPKVVRARMEGRLARAEECTPCAAAERIRQLRERVKERQNGR